MRTISFSYYNKIIIIYIINCSESILLLFIARCPLYSGLFFVHVSTTSPVSLTSSTRLPLLYRSLFRYAFGSISLQCFSLSSCKLIHRPRMISIPTMRYGLRFNSLKITRPRFALVDFSISDAFRRFTAPRCVTRIS